MEPNTIYSLQINPGAAGVPTLDLGANTLTVTGGGILRTSANTGNSNITNGTLTAGSGAAPAELVFALNNAWAKYRQVDKGSLVARKRNEF